MFLRPHHFQTAQRHALHFAHLDEKWDHPYNWGLRAIDLDHDALANYRFVVRVLKARLRDGTLVSIPEDGKLPEVELRGAFERDNTVTVYLAVPVLNLGRANVAGNGAAEAGRYTLITQDLEDENTGINPQPVQVRLLNIKLLTSAQDHAGYEVLPIARVDRSAGADALPKLDKAYIPPHLACDGWPPMQTEILEPIYNRIGAVQEQLANQVVTRGIGMESEAQGDRLIIEWLRALNEAAGALSVLVYGQGVHPFQAYLEIARLVGQLAIFDAKAPRTPDIPRYDHDDLQRFYRLKMYLDNLLDKGPKRDYEMRPFEAAGLRMQVTLEPSWLEPVYQMFVGVKSPLSTDECIRLLTGRSLNIKIANSGRVDQIYTRGERGLIFTPFPNPPRALPSTQGLTYLQVRRDSQPAEWQNVHRELSLAVRFSEQHIEGSLQPGQREVRININGRIIPLQFTLYVLKGEVK
jgi:type VI secretion system protein ImpJ